jgi:hypothetical protein
LSERLFDWRERNDLSQGEAALKLRVPSALCRNGNTVALSPGIWRGTPSRRLSVRRVQTVLFKRIIRKRGGAIRDSRIASVVIGLGNRSRRLSVSNGGAAGNSGRWTLRPNSVERLSFASGGALRRQSYFKYLSNQATVWSSRPAWFSGLTKRWPSPG